MGNTGSSEDDDNLPGSSRYVSSIQFQDEPQSMWRYFESDPQIVLPRRDDCANIPGTNLNRLDVPRADCCQPRKSKETPERRVASVQRSLRPLGNQIADENGPASTFDDLQCTFSSSCEPNEPRPQHVSSDANDLQRMRAPN